MLYQVDKARKMRMALLVISKRSNNYLPLDYQRNIQNYMGQLAHGSLPPHGQISDFILVSPSGTSVARLNEKFGHIPNFIVRSTRGHVCIKFQFIIQEYNSILIGHSI